MTVYNAAADLIGRNLAAGRGAKTAVIDSRGAHSYADIDAAANRFAHALALLDIRREERILLCLNDTADFHTCFLGAIKAGVVPVPVNTRLTRDDYAFMLRDSRAQAAFVSANLAPVFEGLHDRLIRDGDMLAYLIANQSADFRRPIPSRMRCASGSTPRGRRASRKGRCTCMAIWRARRNSMPGRRLA